MLTDKSTTDKKKTKLSSQDSTLRLFMKNIYFSGEGWIYGGGESVFLMETWFSYVALFHFLCNFFLVLFCFPLFFFIVICVCNVKTVL